MIRKQDQSIYDIFNKFIEIFLIGSDSILTSNQNIFSEDNISDCIKRFVDNFKDEKGNFESKINDQFNGASDDVKIVFAHANWLWAFSVYDMTVLGKKKAIQICLPNNSQINDKIGIINLIPDQGFGSAGTYHKQNKYWEIAFILKLFKWVIKFKSNQKASENDIKNFIEEVCLFAKYDESDNPMEEWQKNLRENNNSCAMHNILLYLCKPEKYERIASDTHKMRIAEIFSSLIGNGLKSKSIDEQLLQIRGNIKISINNDFDFYDKDITQFWNPGVSDAEYNEFHGLSYKKSIILYGPPGTGKTHNAKDIAKSFIIQKTIERDKQKLKDIFDKRIDIDKRIRRLQLHANYSYEDFIAGISFKNGETEPVKGYLFLLCEEISNDKDKSPYVLILDEINRIDLSRLFGEAFSAIENRDEEVDLSIGKYKLRIPENLYIIGTMNEIDFSLERLDFALRRRFVWFPYGFDRDKLLVMINDKRGNIRIDDDEISIFIERAEKLKYKIDEIKELGKQYEIGHTFFSEIIEIAKQFAGRPRYKNKIKLFKAGGPIEVLWNISIAPMIDAFLGNLDESQKEERIKEMKEIFINGK